MNRYYIKLADKNIGTWAIEDRGSIHAVTSTVKMYTTKRIVIKCGSTTLSQGNAHYLVVEGTMTSFTTDETIIE